MIRRMMRSDVPDAVEMLQALHLESRYADYNFDRQKVIDLCHRLIADPQGIALRSPNGLFLGGVGEAWFGKDLCAYEIVTYVIPASRGTFEGPSLVKAYVRQGFALGAIQITICNTTGVQTARTDRLFEQVGFSRMGGNFIMTSEILEWAT